MQPEVPEHEHEPIIQTYQELTAQDANVENVENASISVHVNADCAVAAILNKPCAASTHDAAIAIDQPDTHIHIDLEPIAVGLSIIGICIAFSTALIARKLM